MRHWALLFLSFALLAPLPVVAGSAEQALTERYYEQLARSAGPEWHQFLHRMPKGADIHAHLSGSIDVENYVNWALQADLCIEPETQGLWSRLPDGSCFDEDFLSVRDYLTSGARRAKLIDAWSMRPFHGRYDASGRQHFIDAFTKFYAATEGHMGQMLAVLARQAEAEHIFYMEPMIPLKIMGGRDKKALKPSDFEGLYQLLTHDDRRWLRTKVATVIKRLDDAEREGAQALGCRRWRECPVTMRYILQVRRYALPRNVFEEMLVGYELMKRDSRFVGITLVGDEATPRTQRHYHLHMQMLRFFSRVYAEQGAFGVTLHAGELAETSDHIAQAVNVAGARRIGHATYLMREKDAAATLRRLAEKPVAIELNLTSNAMLLGEGVAPPVALFLEERVPMVISTDNAGVLGTSLSQEYTRAAQAYHLSYSQLKMLARNSLQYAFIGGQSFWTDTESWRARTLSCKNSVASRNCERSLRGSAKALLQRRLELEFDDFEKRMAAAYNKQSDKQWSE